MKASMILALGAAAAISAHKNETMTTSTVYSTHVYTITSCAPTVTDCPEKGSVTTDIISLYTTVCPVAETTPPYPTSTPGGYEHDHGPSTSTKYTTEIITISKCPETEKHCPYTTAPITKTTVYPCPETTPAAPTTYPAGPSYPEGPGSSIPVYPTSKPAGQEYPSKPAPPVLSTITIKTCVPTTYETVITVKPSTTYVQTSTYPSGTIPKPPTNTTVPFTGGAAAQKAGGLLMAVGLAAAFL